MSALINPIKLNPVG